MGLFDWLTGSKAAPAGVPRQNVAELRTRLLAVNRDTAPFTVRDGAPEGVDLVAEWKIVDAQWYEIFAKASLERSFNPARTSLKGVPIVVPIVLVLVVVLTFVLKRTTYGLHLYAERDYAIRKLAKLSTDGLVDNSFFTKAAGIAQDLPDGPPAAEQISWAKIYVARFPSPVIEKLLAGARSLSYMYLGGLPPE